MTQELKHWLSTHENILELVDDGELAEVISQCPVKLREELYNLLLELNNDVYTDFDINLAASRTSATGGYYGLKQLTQTAGVDDSKYIAVKKPKSGVYPVTLVSGMGRNNRGVVFDSQEAAMTFTNTLRTQHPDMKALPYKIPSRSTRSDYVSIVTDCGTALISSEAKEKLDVVQHASSEELANKNIVKKQTDYIRKVFSEQDVRNKLRECVFPNDTYLRIYYYDDAVVVEWYIHADSAHIRDTILSVVGDKFECTAYDGRYRFQLKDETPLHDIAVTTYAKYGVLETNQSKFRLYPITWHLH